MPAKKTRAEPEPKDTPEYDPPEHVVGTWTFGDDVYQYALLFGFDREGRLGPLQVRIRGLEGALVTRTALREFPLGAKVAEHQPSREDVFRSMLSAGEIRPEWRDIAVDIFSKVSPVPPRRGGRRRLDDERLGEVARVYEEAWRVGNPPVMAVRAHFNDLDKQDWAYSTVRKWVQKARERGLLAPAPAERRPGIAQRKGK